MPRTAAKVPSVSGESSHGCMSKNLVQPDLLMLFTGCVRWRRAEGRGGCAHHRGREGPGGPRPSRGGLSPYWPHVLPPVAPLQMPLRHQFHLLQAKVKKPKRHNPFMPRVKVTSNSFIYCDETTGTNLKIFLGTSCFPHTFFFNFFPADPVHMLHFCVNLLSHIVECFTVVVEWP